MLPTPNGPGGPDDDARYRQFFARAIDRLAKVPGVRAAGAVSALPLADAYSDNSFEIEGSPTPPGQARPDEEIRTATPGYIEAMVDGPAVMMVNRAFAEKFWPGQDALGKRIRIHIRQNDWRTIVGVVGDVHEYGLDAAVKPQMVVPYAQVVRPTMSIVLRSSGRAPVMPAARAALAEIDPNQPIFDVRTMGERLSRSLEQRRFTLIVLEAFAVLALVMAALGLYAVMAHSVAQRTHEIGVRMALGAQRLGVVALVARESAALVGAGAVIGIVGSLVLARLVTQLLFGVNPADPITLAASVGVLAAVAALATYLPVRRAARVDPMVALRYE